MTISCKENVFYLDRIKYQKKYSGVMDIYALKFKLNLNLNIHSLILDERDIQWPQNEYKQGLKHDTRVVVTYHVQEIN